MTAYKELKTPAEAHAAVRDGLVVDAGSPGGVWLRRDNRRHMDWDRWFASGGRARARIEAEGEPDRYKYCRCPRGLSGIRHEAGCTALLEPEPRRPATPAPSASVGDELTLLVLNDEGCEAAIQPRADGKWEWKPRGDGTPAVWAAACAAHQSAEGLTSGEREARDGWHMANGVAELAMKHRDEAERSLQQLSRAVQLHADDLDRCAPLIECAFPSTAKELRKAANELRAALTTDSQP